MFTGVFNVYIVILSYLRSSYIDDYESFKSATGNCVVVVDRMKKNVRNVF